MPVAYPIFNPAVFNDTDVFDSGSIENQFRQPLPSPDFARRRLLGHVGKITCLSFMCLESGGGNGKHLLIR